MVAFNLLLASVSTVTLLIVLMRVGLLAAMVAFALHSTLEASVLGWNLWSWPGESAWFAIVLVLGLGGVGCMRALTGRVAVELPAD